MARNRIWVLNFDAEDEMANPAGSPSNAVRARFDALATRLGPLVPEGDVLYRQGVARPDEYRDWNARAWCPTPRAVNAWRRIGARFDPPPSFETLRSVNHRSFCAALGQTLPGADFVRSLADLERVIVQDSPTGQWLLKRPFGYTGRGRKTTRTGPLDPALIDWIAASFASNGGLQVEPLVERCGDFGLHGFIARNGELTVGEPTVQQMAPHGAWIATERAPSEALSPQEREVLASTIDEIAAALRKAGYFGPFGFDAFRWVDSRGALHFNPRCDINARYSMGWAIGMGARRPDLLD